MSESGSTTTKPVPAPRRAEVFGQIVECVAVVSRHSSAILRMDG